MSDFSVALGAVGQAVSTTRATAGDLAGELRRLSGAVDDVLDGRWRGAAASAFGRAWADWRRAADQLLAALDELAGGLDAAGATYEQRDQLSAQQLRVSAR